MAYAAVPRPFKECKEMFWAECQRLADGVCSAYEKSMKPVYICGQKAVFNGNFAPSEAIWVEWTACHCNDELTYVFPEYVPPQMDQVSTALWLSDKLSHEPCWLFAD